MSVLAGQLLFCLHCHTAEKDEVVSTESLVGGGEIVSTSATQER